MKLRQVLWAIGCVIGAATFFACGSDKADERKSNDALDREYLVAYTEKNQYTLRFLDQQAKPISNFWIDHVVRFKVSNRLIAYTTSTDQLLHVLRSSARPLEGFQPVAVNDFYVTDQFIIYQPKGTSDLVILNSEGQSLIGAPLKEVEIESVRTGKDLVGFYSKRTDENSPKILNLLKLEGMRLKGYSPLEVIDFAFLKDRLVYVGATDSRLNILNSKAQPIPGTQSKVCPPGSILKAAGSFIFLSALTKNPGDDRYSIKTYVLDFNGEDIAGSGNSIRTGQHLLIFGSTSDRIVFSDPNTLQLHIGNSRLEPIPGYRPVSSDYLLGVNQKHIVHRAGDSLRMYVRDLNGQVVPGYEPIEVSWFQLRPDSVE